MGRVADRQVPTPLWTYTIHLQAAVDGLVTPTGTCNFRLFG